MLAIRQFVRRHSNTMTYHESLLHSSAHADECRHADKLILDAKDLVSSYGKEDTIEMVAISVRTKSGFFMKHYLRGGVPLRLCAKDYVDMYE